MPYSQKNNPVKMMKSALEMHKAEKKAGMHRDSAMYMNSPMYSGHESPMNSGHESPMNSGHESPMNSGHKSPMKRESRELKDMPIVDIEKGKAKGDMKKRADIKIKPKEDKPNLNRHKGPSPVKVAKPDFPDIDKDGNTTESMTKAAADKKKGSPAKKYDRVVFGGNKGDKSKTKPGKKDFEGKGSPAKKYDRVVLGGNKGDKSKTKPGKKDYMGKKK